MRARVPRRAEPRAPRAANPAHITDPTLSSAGCAGRMEAFFGPVTVKSSTTGAKRKEAPAPKGKGAAAKKGKAGGVGRGGKK